MTLLQEIANIVGDYEVTQGRARPNLPVDRLVELDVAKQNHRAAYNSDAADVMLAAMNSDLAISILKGE